MDVFSGLLQLECGLAKDVGDDVKKGFAENPTFFVRKDKNGHAKFLNSDRSRCFCSTSKIVSVNKIEDKCIQVRTASGHLYSMCPVRVEAPTTAELLTVVSKKRSDKPINYGNGYLRYEFTFNRECSEEEFIEFLKANNHIIHAASGWWDDYSEITGSGNTWTYTWVRAYTD